MADNMFLSQSSLLAWLNSTLMLKLEKIEEVGVAMNWLLLESILDGRKALEYTKRKI